MGWGSGTPSSDLSPSQAVSSRILKGLPTLLQLPEFQEVYQMLLPVHIAKLGNYVTSECKQMAIHRVFV
jgi:hypothetical protein